MDINQLITQFGATPGGLPALMGSHGGALDALGDLKKALTASDYQTDVNALSGGGALGIQSLDTVMKTTVQEQDHFVFMRALQQTSATNIVDEYTRQNGVGGFIGGSTNTQMGVVRAAQGDYSREVGMVKFLMTLRQVGYVLNIGKNIVNAVSTEEANGALQLMTDAEYLAFHGDATVSPTEFDGIITQIENEVASGGMDGDHIVDLDGAALNDITPFSRVNQAASRYGSWGRSTDVYLPNVVQTDLNNGIDPAFRWSSQGNNTPLIGAHVEGIRLSHGILKTNMDTFLHDENFPATKPFEVTWADVAASNIAIKPASVTAGTPASDTASKFTSARAGNYYYAVASIDKDGKGMSACAVSAQVAIAAGQSVVLTIARSTATTESGYAIYRSRRNGTNTLSDMRLVKKIKASGGATTLFTDQNRYIPGTVSVPVLNMTKGADAIGWRQFQPMVKIPLPFGVGGVPVHSWFQFLFGYLRVTKPKHHGLIKGILPSTQIWQPF